MGTGKRRSSKTSLKESVEPEITLEFPEDILKPQTEENEEPKESAKTKQKKEDKPSIGEEIKENIAKVKAKEGVVGYILRNASSANIDLNDPTKIIDYAVLSSSAFEASEELSNAFELGNIKYVLTEGKTVKLLSFTREDTKVSVFMETNVNHNRIYKDLLS